METSGEDNRKKGLESTGLTLPPNRHGNLKSASTDDNLQDILLHIKSSKATVTISISFGRCSNFFSELTCVILGF